MIDVIFLTHLSETDGMFALAAAHILSLHGTWSHMFGLSRCVFKDLSQRAEWAVTFYFIHEASMRLVSLVQELSSSPGCEG